MFRRIVPGSRQHRAFTTQLKIRFIRLVRRSLKFSCLLPFHGMACQAGVGSRGASIDGYEDYLSDVREWNEVDQQTRLLVLDIAASVEVELYAIVAIYLGGGDVLRRAVAERHVAK